ncbi:hypothetical protein ACFWP7_13390 [Streptomyces sp. NPDC058470]|uniref:hypothetical protein n=1 Tax=Streptomyces sp. NPDC058470 TaxID=3346515 RepID=UPI0036596470
MSNLLKTGAVAAACAALLIATSGSAQAASWEVKNIQQDETLGNGPVIGSAKWTDTGDKLKVCDKRADGHSVMVYVVNKGGTTPLLKVRALSNGKCATGTKNLNENKTYEWWVSHGNDGDDMVWMGKP